MFENLRSLRLSLGLTQNEFAKAIGVPGSTFSGYEQGNREPGSKFWIAVAQKYGVTIDYLMGFSDIPRTLGDRERESEERKRLEKLTGNFDELNAEGQERLVEYSDFLLGKGDYQKNFQSESMEKEA